MFKSDAKIFRSKPGKLLESDKAVLFTGLAKRIIKFLPDKKAELDELASPLKMPQKELEKFHDDPEIHNIIVILNKTPDNRTEYDISCLMPFIK